MDSTCSFAIHYWLCIFKMRVKIFWLLLALCYQCMWGNLPFNTKELILEKCTGELLLFNYSEGKYVFRHFFCYLIYFQYIYPVQMYTPFILRNMNKNVCIHKHKQSLKINWQGKKSSDSILYNIYIYIYKGYIKININAAATAAAKKVLMQIVLGVIINKCCHSHKK